MDELIFLLAGCEARRATLRERVRAELARADFGVLANELAARRLLELIGTRACEVGDDLVPAGFRDAVERAVASARERAGVVQDATAAVCSRLGEAGIRALPLKGPLLALEAHGDTGLRETADVDVLVAPEALEAAVRALADAGYSPPAAGPPAPGLPALHVALVSAGRPEVDVHWRVHWYESAFSAEMLARAVPGDDGLLRAQPDGLAAALLLFYAREGFHGVRLAADLAAWWDRRGGGLPPAFIEGQLSRHPHLAPALTAAAATAERITGVPAPGWLGPDRAPRRRAALAARLADWTQRGDRDQLAANVSLVGGLLGPPGSVREFARRELWPDGATLAAGTKHAAKMCARYAIAIWRVRGGRSWAPLPPDG